MTKLCRDCKWSHSSLLDIIFGMRNFAKCLHPALQKEQPKDVGRPDLVTGKIVKPEKDMTYYCSVNRAYECGQDGVFWEPRR